MAILHLSAIYLKVFHASGRNCALHKNREKRKVRIIPDLQNHLWKTASVCFASVNSKLSVQHERRDASKMRCCKQRIAPDFCRFPGRSARSSARCPSGSVFASDSRHRSGRCARHSRCATQNCRSATSGKAVDVGSVASSAKREQIAVQEIAPVGVVDLSVQEHVVITAQSALSHIERPLVAVKEKGVRAQFASIENHFF